MMETTKKKYEFRRLGSKDVFVMTKIIGKVGVNKFSECLNQSSVQTIISKMKDSDNKEENITAVGLSVALEIVNVICSNLDKCENEIYQLLSQTSNLKVKEVQELDMVTFFEMIADFVKKEEFKDFFKAASKLFN